MELDYREKYYGKKRYTVKMENQMSEVIAEVISQKGTRESGHKVGDKFLIGQQTPPVASVLITACSIARANIWDVTRVNIWFIAVLLTVLLMCTYIPAIPMFLVEYFYRS